MRILSLKKRFGPAPVLLRVVILGALVQGIDFAQSPYAVLCSLTNGQAEGFFGGVTISGSFTQGASPDMSTISVVGAYSYTFTGPLNGPGYIQVSQIPVTPCVLLGCVPTGPGSAGLHVTPENGNTTALLNFEDTGEDFIGSGNLSCTAITPPPTNPPPTQLSPSQVKTTASGLAYSRVTHTFNGTITLTNISGSAISGPIQVLLVGITAPVTLANATGYSSGTPYLTVPSLASFAPGQVVTVAVQFSNPTNALISLTPEVFRGSFQ